MHAIVGIITIVVLFGLVGWATTFGFDSENARGETYRDLRAHGDTRRAALCAALFYPYPRDDTDS